MQQVCDKFCGVLPFYGFRREKDRLFSRVGDNIEVSVRDGSLCLNCSRSVCWMVELPSSYTISASHVVCETNDNGTKDIPFDQFINDLTRWFVGCLDYTEQEFLSSLIGEAKSTL